MQFLMKLDRQIQLQNATTSGLPCARTRFTALVFTMLAVFGGINSQILAQTDPSISAPSSAKTESVAERQIAEDRAKILQLANDLKEEVDKSTVDMLSVNVIRKAAEIQRLAHDIKEKMKQANGEN